MFVQARERLLLSLPQKKLEGAGTEVPTPPELALAVALVLIVLS